MWIDIVMRYTLPYGVLADQVSFVVVVDFFPLWTLFPR